MRFLAIALLAFFTSACGEVSDERYSDFNAAKADGAVQRGWIPTFVPQSAYDIHDVHDVDTNAQSLGFKVPASDLAAMISDMRVAHANEAEAVRRVVKAAGWQASPHDLVTYQLCQEGRPAALAINRNTGAAFYTAPVIWKRSPCPAQ